jgi:hypothetical protein
MPEQQPDNGGRRAFLTNTAVIGAGLTLGPLALAKGETRMNTRRLGTLEVSELGAGCMSISANYGPPRRPQARH